MAIGLSRGAAMMHARAIDLRSPATWEFSGFSQNGEDGIIDVLLSQLHSKSRYCVEIGTGDGFENNTAWLVIARKYSGIMIDSNPRLMERGFRLLSSCNIGFSCCNMFVTRNSAQELRKLAWYHDPDIFSLDIDGNDFYIAKSLLDSGFRPKIFVVEYNAALGSERSVTIEYRDEFVVSGTYPEELYFGVSITGWKRFFERAGYRFVTVDQNGVNAFFVDEKHFSREFLDNIVGLEFANNRFQFRKYQLDSSKLAAQLADLRFAEI
jgi:hypothetical protein